MMHKMFMILFSPQHVAISCENYRNLYLTFWDFGRKFGELID